MSLYTCFLASHVGEKDYLNLYTYPTLLTVYLRSGMEKQIHLQPIQDARTDKIRD